MGERVLAAPGQPTFDDEVDGLLDVLRSMQRPARMLTLGFRSEPLFSGQTAILENFHGMPFQPARIVVPSAVSPYFEISRVYGDVVLPGQVVRLHVRRVNTLGWRRLFGQRVIPKLWQWWRGRRAVAFRASVVGYAVRGEDPSDPHRTDAVSRVEEGSSRSTPRGRGFGSGGTP